MPLIKKDMFAHCRFTFCVFCLTIEALTDSYTTRLHLNNRTQINNRDYFFQTRDSQNL